jgi:hypothetical protein
MHSNTRFYTAPFCAALCSLLALFSFSNIQKTIVIDEPDRKTECEYARDHGTNCDEIKTRYAATGEFSCPGSTSTAQLIHPKHIVVSGHGLFNRRSCKLHAPHLSQCRFTTAVDGIPQTVPIKSLVSTGTNCTRGTIFNPFEDWALLELKRPVAGIQPYGITREKIKKEHEVTFIGFSIDFVESRRNGTLYYPKHVGDCKILNNIGDTFGTDCDASYGASGGSFLTRGPNPILLGIARAAALGYETAYKRREGSGVNTETEAGRKHEPVRCSRNHNKLWTDELCMTEGIPVQRGFLEALERVTGRSE